MKLSNWPEMMCVHVCVCVSNKGTKAVGRDHFWNQQMVVSVVSIQSQAWPLKGNNLRALSQISIPRRQWRRPRPRDNNGNRCPSSRANSFLRNVRRLDRGQPDEPRARTVELVSSTASCTQRRRPARTTAANEAGSPWIACCRFVAPNTMHNPRRVDH